jgi:hypothetical protein
VSPLVQDKLWDLLVNLISILISGGLLLLLIEWRRHRREQSQWKREDTKLEIDVPRAEINHTAWAIDAKMNEGMQLQIYKRQLLGTVKTYSILVDFVIRNTTNGELVIISYGVEENAPPGMRTYQLYDLETLELIMLESQPATRLQPLGTIARTALIYRSLELNEKMENSPTNVRIYSQTSEGVRIQKEIELKTVPTTLIDFTKDGDVHPIAYIRKFHPELGEDEIPF